MSVKALDSSDDLKTVEKCPPLNTTLMEVGSMAEITLFAPTSVRGRCGSPLAFTRRLLSHRASCDCALGSPVRISSNSTYDSPSGSPSSSSHCCHCNFSLASIASRSSLQEWKPLIPRSPSSNLKSVLSENVMSSIIGSISVPAPSASSSFRSISVIPSYFVKLECFPPSPHARLTTALTSMLWSIMPWASVNVLSNRVPWRLACRCR
mmetsp:Transcript_76758/g.220430  ORF Transcript_76758/g.220430 Transcript_76758/m.220430 type:complete len:208 (+) Transcript_76758:248-871(+)